MSVDGILCPRMGLEASKDLGHAIQFLRASAILESLGGWALSAERGLVLEGGDPLEFASSLLVLVTSGLLASMNLFLRACLILL